MIQRDFTEIILFFATVILLGSFNPVAGFFLPQVTRTDDAVVIDFSVKGSEYADPIDGRNVYEEILNPAFVPLPFFDPYAMTNHPWYNGWSYSFGFPGLSTRADTREGAPSARQFDGEEEEEEDFGEKQDVKQLQISGATTTTARPTTRTTRSATTTARPTTRTTRSATTTARPATTTARPTTTTTRSTTTTTRSTTTTTRSTTTTTPPRPTSTTTTPAPAPAIQCGRGPTKFPYRDHDHDRTAISERISLSEGGESEVVVQAKKNAWPFIVILKNSAGVFFCAATLISDTRVLLAAQCMEQLSLVDMSGVTVLIGVTGPTNIQMTRRISKLYLHSQYNAANYANDIAIIILDTPVVISRSVAPACLPPASSDPDQYADKKAIILGWGTADINTPSENLLQAKVDLVANSECRSDSDFGRFVSDTSLCVSSTNVFTCAGDIGGPVVILPAPGTWTVIGINSYTKSDCSATGLKTRVSAYRDWIDQYMN